MAGLSPTQRTLKHYRDKGLTCAIVEKWNPHMRIRQDMFGIIDIVALHPTAGVVGIQSTGSAFRSHYLKLTQEKANICRTWLQTPGTTLILIGWRKVKKVRGQKIMIWKPRIQEITLQDLDPAYFTENQNNESNPE